MSMSRLAATAATMLIATSAAAFAYESKASIDAREQRQLGAIEQGRQSGAITWREGHKLRAEQKRIAATEAEFLSDGRLSKKEKRVLKQMQDEAAEHIKEERQDGQRRAAFLPRFGR